MGKKTKIHNIREVFNNSNLLEGATFAQSDDGKFKVMGFTIIRAGLSGNGNYYSEKVLKEASKKGVFADKQIRTDHKELTKSLSVNDVVGKITKTWYDPQMKAMRADGFFSSTVSDLVTRVKEGLIGDLSINARGVTELQRVDGKLRRNVKSITDGYSVDLVCEAAAGGTLHEEFLKTQQICERMRNKMEDIEKLTIEELKEARPDLVQKLQEEVKVEEKADPPASSQPDSITKEDVKTIISTSLSEAFKARDEEDAKRRVSETLSESISAAVDGILTESNVDDSIKDYVRKNLAPFATSAFKKLEDIDKKKLSEERDRVLKDFEALAKKFSANPPKVEGDGAGRTTERKLMKLIS